MIIETATEIVREHGLSGLSAREIAKRIGYSPGTLYNVFKDRDEIVLQVEGQHLDRLAEHLGQVGGDLDPRARILALAEAYLAFTHADPHLWNLLFEHRLGEGRDAPEWYQAKLDELMRCLEQSLQELMPGMPAPEIERTARVLWAGVHGVTSLSTSDKLSNVTSEAAEILVRELVKTFLDGLDARMAAATAETANAQPQRRRARG